LALGVVGTLLYLVFRPPPPSADLLYQQAKKVMQSDNFEEQQKAAANGPIAQYLKHYKNRHDDQAREVRVWSDQIAVARKERLIDNYLQKERINSPLKVEAQDEIEKEAFAAAKAEDKGDRESAIERWRRVKQNNLPIWNLVADKHLGDLESLEGIDTRFQQLYKRIHSHREEQPLTDLREKQAFRAWRAEHCALGDRRLARSLLRSLQRETAGNPRQHRWYLYAACNANAKRLADKDQDKDKKEIKAEAEELLNKARDGLKAKRIRPEDALLISLDILALYEAEDDMQSLVEEARKLRDESLKQ
jgi:hypothetical protein